MIEILRKEDCVGCGACVQRCPKSCIALQPDEQGFLYPQVDVSRCIGCALCEKVCPVINQDGSRVPRAVYAAKKRDNAVRMKSSSGGLFFALAKRIIDDGGVVFGARFDEKHDVVHDYAETVGGLAAFQGSKYVQSRTGGCYEAAGRFLREGRTVMFTGTPCQIAALRKYLRKDYGAQLVLVDVACHGVPSPRVWRAYIDSIEKGPFDRINFRDKRNGWMDYGFSLARNGEDVFYQRSEENMYMNGFLRDLYLRPSCSACPAKQGKSGSDITLADCWGIQDFLPGFDCRDGASALMINTAAGQSLVDAVASEIDLSPVAYSDVVGHNRALIESAAPSSRRAEFWHRFHKEGISCLKPLLRSMGPSFMSRLRNHLLRKLGRS